MLLYAILANNNGIAEIASTPRVFDNLTSAIKLLKWPELKAKEPVTFRANGTLFDVAIYTPGIAPEVDGMKRALVVTVTGDAGISGMAIIPPMAVDSGKNGKYTFYRVKVEGGKPGQYGEGTMGINDNKPGLRRMQDVCGLLESAANTLAEVVHLLAFAESDGFSKHGVIPVHYAAVRDKAFSLHENLDGFLASEMAMAEALGWLDTLRGKAEEYAKVLSLGIAADTARFGESPRQVADSVARLAEMRNTLAAYLAS